MNVIRELRRQAGLTQAQLAEAAGTSQPTIAAYESGNKSPRVRTLWRIARSVGLEPVISYESAFTREERRSLALHRAIAERLLEAPEEVLDKARGNLKLMSERHPHARGLLDEWQRILSRPVDEIAAVLVDPTPSARELRKVTPFAGVLDPHVRAAVYRRFARTEAAA
jgi:transcriptional regulator with XRE-family HTH domain